MQLIIEIKPRLKRNKVEEAVMDEKVKIIETFLKKHKTELIVAGVAALAYRIGFKRGCNATHNAVSEFLNGLESVLTNVGGVN